ncbi:MAG: hypothetical protein ACYCR4_10255 [Acidimicrobiales bacterium]
MFPLANLPSWLTALTTIDPLTYAVDPLREAVFGHLHVSPLALRALDPGVSWDGWRIPVPVELGFVALVVVVLLAAAMAAFSKSD